MTDFSLEIGRLAARIGAASQGKYIVEDVLLCPEFDYESITWPGLARWNTARQRFELFEIIPGSEPSCGCGRKNLELAPLFLTARRISMVAMEAPAPPALVSEPVGHFCQACGSDDLIRSLIVPRDPVLDIWVAGEVLGPDSMCLACGFDGPPRVERLHGPALAEQKRAARCVAARVEQMRKVVQKLAAYVGG
jgi:hypothetical protein